MHICITLPQWVKNQPFQSRGRTIPNKLYQFHWWCLHMNDFSNISLFSLRIDFKSCRSFLCLTQNVTFLFYHNIGLYCEIIFIMEIPIPGKTVLVLRQCPDWSPLTQTGLSSLVAQSDYVYLNFHVPIVLVLSWTQGWQTYYRRIHVLNTEMTGWT